ncbi:MAG: hypothetical protein V1729_04425, partial [Candidatus Woesearchaeota archaeon]
MKKSIRSFTYLFIIIVLASAAIASTAKIVNEGTTPQGHNSLEINANDGAIVTYTVKDVEPGQYTASFYYKILQNGKKFTFQAKSGSAIYTTSNVLTSTSWNTYSVTFDIGGSVSRDVTLNFDPDSAMKFYIDALQFAKAEEFTKFNNFDYETGCCPYDYCWTGGLLDGHEQCVHDDYYARNVSMPPLGTLLAEFGGVPGESSSMLDAPSGFRCINGQWKFSRAKMSPIYDGAGFCPDESQCFIGSSSEHPDDALFACVENSTYHEYSYTDAQENQQNEWFYCYDGNWTTRTKEIALQMFKMVEGKGKPYTIACDRFDRTLNPDQTFSYYRDYYGDNIITILTSGFVNEFCVMTFDGQVVSGFSLNNLDLNQTLGEEGGCVKGNFACLTEGNCDAEGCLISVPPGFTTPQRSFIQLLKGPDHNDYCNSAIQNTDGNYHQCQNTDVYYNAKLNTVIFTKPTPTPQSVPFTGTVTQTLIEKLFTTLMDALKNLLGIGGAIPQFQLIQ